MYFRSHIKTLLFRLETIWRESLPEIMAAYIWRSFSIHHEPLFEPTETRQTTNSNVLGSYSNLRRVRGARSVWKWLICSHPEHHSTVPGTVVLLILLLQCGLVAKSNSFLLLQKKEFCLVMLFWNFTVFLLWVVARGAPHIPATRPGPAETFLARQPPHLSLCLPCVPRE